jgi:ABC-2 type transport system permease protein
MSEGVALNLRVIGALGIRAVRQTFRRPQLMAPIIIFPTILLAIQTGGAGRAPDLPIWQQVLPGVEFFDFMIAGAMIQSAMLGGNSGGIALAVDLESGFADRLFSAPIARSSIVLGRLVGTAALGLVTAIWFLAIAFVFGAEVEAGAPGVLLIVALVVAAAVAFGAIGAALALRAGNASTVQGFFPLVFVILFLSTAFFPGELLLEPAQTIAEGNPLSFIVEAVRDPAISVVSVSHLSEGIAAMLGIAALGLVAAGRAVQRRVRIGG